jgi:hypothetical protein
MDTPDTELLFPPRLTPGRGARRGADWDARVGRAARAEPAGRDRLAFVLMMVRLAGCGSCNSNSYRAMRGCAQCAGQAVARFRGSDADLLKLFTAAQQEVVRYLEGSAVIGDR